LVIAMARIDQFALLIALSICATIPDHVIAKRRGPKPCTYLEVTSKAGISKQYPEYLGVFEREKESSDQAGRGVYLKSNGIALWWSNQVGTWKIGSKKHVGSNVGNVYNSKEELCNTEISILDAEKCGPWWKYWNGEEWQYDNSVKISCFGHQIYEKKNGVIVRDRSVGHAFCEERVHLDEKKKYRCDYNIQPNVYCLFPERHFLQTETRYDDIGNVTRACDEDDECNEFYFSKVENAYYICPFDSEIKKMKGYEVYKKVDED